MVRVIVVFAIVAAVAATTDKIDARMKLRGRSRRYLLSPLGSTRIQEGFKVGQHLADLMAAKKFEDTVKTIATNAKILFSTINPYFGFALSLARGPTPELQLLKQLFTKMEERFDQVDIQFEQLRTQVAFIPAQVHLNDWEHNINAVQHELMMLPKMQNGTSYIYAKAQFIKIYHGTYESAGIKLYNSIMEGGPTSGGLFQEFRTFRSNNRNETQLFMIGIMNLLMEASKLELTYASLNNDPSYAHREADLNKHIDDVKNKMAAIDEDIVKHYKDDLTTFLTTFESQHRGQSRANFSQGLYQEITAKFYWRDWIVAIAGPQSDRYRKVHSCDINQRDNHGISIRIASVDKAKRPMDINSAKQILESSFKWAFFADATVWFDNLPDEVRNQCTNYTQAGVGTEKFGLFINHADGRFADHNSGYNLYQYAWLFG